MKAPMIVGVNGPPQSGKGHVIDSLAESFARHHPDLKTRIFSVPEVIYARMIADGDVPGGIPYAEFKKQENARARTIAKSRILRADDSYAICRFAVNDVDYWASDILIYDNFGFQWEVDFFAKISEYLFVLRIDVPWKQTEPDRSLARRLVGEWRGDTRAPVQHFNMITAYDSQQMLLLLGWLLPQYKLEAGPYHGFISHWNAGIRSRRDTP